MKEENIFTIQLSSKIAGSGIKSQVNLVDIVDDREFEKNYPHTVGFFREPIDEATNWWL